jgi:outer membrane biosynthesis protein TonB
VYVSADRAGHIREAWPGGCDNAGLEDGLDDIVRKWQLKPAAVQGVPVQVAARLTFPFTTVLTANPMPVLSDAEARAVATNTVAPAFPKGSGTGGTEVTIRVTVDIKGVFAGCDNVENLPEPLFRAADDAVQHWHFKPYVKDGTPEAFYARITFRIP